MFLAVRTPRPGWDLRAKARDRRRTGTEDWKDGGRTLETFALAGRKFQLWKAVESSALEDRPPYDAAHRAIDVDPAHLLCVVDDPDGAVVATMQLTSDNSRTDANSFYECLGFSRSHAGFKLQLG